MTTLEEAVVALAGPPSAYAPADVGFAHGCAARIRVNAALIPEHRRRAWRLLEAYKVQLAALGIDYAAIEKPDPTQTPTPPPAGPIGRTRVWLDARGRLCMESPYNARQIVREQIPAAKWDRGAVCYVLPATPQAALAIADALGKYGIDATDDATDLVRRGAVARRAGAKRTAVDLPPVPGSKTEAWEHQRQAFWFARELPGALLDMEMGTGKSKVVVDLIGDSGAASTLIVCPERVVGVWPKQFAIHSGREFHIIDPRKMNKRGEWSLVPIADRVDLYEHALHECGCGLPHVLMTNYAASAHEPFKSWSIRQHFDYIAYDECHRLRSHGGVWSKWARDMHPHATRHIGGTGTLQSQTPLDVFGQARAVEPGLFGATYIGFEKRYAIKGGYQGRVVKDYQNEDELAAKLSSITYHAGEEVLDLPDMLPDLTVTGRLSPRARKAYDEIEQEMYAEVLRVAPDGTELLDEVSIANVLVRILRCQQMTGGALTLDSGHIEEIDHAKADLLLEELEDLPDREPTIVFARFIHDLDKIEEVAAKLKRPYHELSGRRGDALASDATLNPEAVIAGVQIQAGGTGVDFTRAAFGYYYSVGHSLGDYLQSRKRLQRPGQLRSVRFRHLVMEGTIDEDVYEALANRQRVVDRISAKVMALQRAS